METVKGYELTSFFAYVIGVLERLGVPYMVVGGFATLMYGEPRLTIDVDIVVDMVPAQVRPFVEAFPIPDYYANEGAIRASLAACQPFNVIQSSTAAKVDLIPLPSNAAQRAAFQQRRRVAYDEAGHSAMFTSAENLILEKLGAYRSTGSDKHLRDARGILATLIYGEPNVFRPADAAAILARARRALVPGGLLLLEPHTYEAVERMGHERPSWWAAESGLYSDRPHLVLEEGFWDASAQAATRRFYVVDAATAEVTRYAQSLQAYSDEEYRSLLDAQGFEDVHFYPALAPAPDEPRGDFLAIVARAGS